jgi:hypothetical protein
VSHTSRYPKGAIDRAIEVFEAIRVDYNPGPLLDAIDDALDRLYRIREIEEGRPHPYRLLADRRGEVEPEHSDPHGPIHQ